MDPIIFYGDEILDLTNNKLRNQYLRQHIKNTVNAVTHFTGEPQIDSSAFKYFQSPLEFKSFDEYKEGQQGLVVIGLHGGHSPLKLELITDWFNSNENRKRAWLDPKCHIVLDYGQEGFSTDFFPFVWDWIHSNNLDNRVVYINGATNVDALYQMWCAKFKKRPNMLTAWYGFFTNWLSTPENIVVKINNEYRYLTSNMPLAKWQPGTPRYMCLNRRPHHHRILIATLLEHNNLLDKGTVSLPLEFFESEVAWDKEHWDLPHQWSLVQNQENGTLDYLNDSFSKLCSKLPLIADTEDFGTNHAMDLNVDFYQRYPINIVTETLFFTWSAFTSEKIWKPMVAGQIFVVMASPYYLQGLQDLGFKTFGPYINESYDQMTNDVERAEAVAETIKEICSLSDSNFMQLLEKCRPIVEHNRRIVMSKESLTRLASLQTVSAIENSWQY
jgi:hypothetical protein